MAASPLGGDNVMLSIGLAVLLEGIPGAMFAGAAHAYRRGDRGISVFWTVFGAVWLGAGSYLGSTLLWWGMVDNPQCGAVCPAAIWWGPTKWSALLTLAVAGFALLIAPFWIVLTSTRDQGTPNGTEAER